ncbi:hypothetical protein Ancab_025324 [Ancistrocladus abbreviatus]
MSNGWLLSVKVVLISSSVLLLAVICKISVPIAIELLTNELPLLWSSAVSWLRPPYLYIVLNCIILTIVASSKLHPQKSDGEATATLHPIRVNVEVDDVRLAPSPVEPFCESEVVPNSPVLFGYVENATERVSEGEVVEKEAGQNVVSDGFPAEERIDGGSGDDEFVISRSTWTPPVRDDVNFSSVSNEKPLASARFGHRKVVKSSPEGKALGVSKPKRHDTLEATWRTITEGRPIPLTRHLRKSDTMESRDRAPHPYDSSPIHLTKKSETFDTATANNNSLRSPPSELSGGRSGKNKREPSLSQDELNRRVEAFIRKFNEEMRLQRQQSLNQYREMIGRGAC